jgi:hypothetical protein
LLEGLRGADRRPGSFRTIQDYIAKPGQAIHDARFVPPPVTELSAALDQFEKFLNAKSGLPLLIELALTHYQFETIHPFVDGNGRIGRLLLSLLLCERGPLAKPLLCLSSYFEKNRERYVDLLLDVSRSGSWQEWIQFFLRGVASQSEDATFSKALGTLATVPCPDANRPRFGPCSEPDRCTFFDPSTHNSYGCWTIESHLCERPTQCREACQKWNSQGSNRKPQKSGLRCTGDSPNYLVARNSGASDLGSATRLGTKCVIAKKNNS